MIARYLYIIGLLSQLFYPMTSFANVQGDLNGFFDSQGYEGNVSSSRAWEAQEAGYYTGGSAYLRNQVRNVQLISLDTPSFKGGCGGIDAYLGGVSYIQGEALTNLAKSIMQASESYAFDLALETTVPQIKTVKDFLEKLEQEANSSLINSCETAQDLVGGVWPKTQASQQRICQDVGTKNGIFSDFAAARQGCADASSGKFDEAMSKAASDPSVKDQVIVNKNLVWDALKTQAFLSPDEELSELVMSLTGTLIFNDDGKAQNVPSLIQSKSLMKTLMQGGQSPIWKCDETDKCLHVSEGQVTVDTEDALIGQVSDMLIELVNAVKNDTPLTDREEGFINSTTIPILKFIETLAQSAAGASPTNVLPYAELIAEDLLEQYLSELLKAEKSAFSGKSYPEELQAALMERINEAQKVVAELSVNTQQKAQSNIDMITQMQTIEKMVSADLSANLKPDLAEGGAQ